METRNPKTFTRDPFAVDPLPTAHYFPSPERQLTKRQKATSVNFTCTVDDTVQEPKGEDKLSALDELFLKDTNSFRTKPFDWTPVEDDGNFDESWPASERPSSISLTGLEDDSQLDLENYQSIVDRFTKDKSTDSGGRQEENGTSQHYNGSRLAVKGMNIQLERRRMPGTATQASGSTGQTGKSKIPVKNARSGSGKPGKMGRKGHTVPDSDQNTDGSVLQRYIDRFRNSAPMSREERLQKSEEKGRKDFWWLSESAHSPSDSFTNLDACDSDQTHPRAVRDREHSPRGVKEPIKEPSGRSQLTEANVEKYKRLQNLAVKKNHRGGIAESPGEKRTLELQQRAEKLLERSVSSIVSTEPAVSTEGLGSNMSDMSSLEEYTYRPKFAGYLETDPPVHHGMPPPMPGQRLPPDDDPLQQWRLRRRMEVAQQSTPIDVQNFNFLSKSDQQKKIDSKLEEFKQRLSGKSPSGYSRTSSNVHFTPAPSQARIQDQIHIQTRNEDDCSQPQIASPTLRRCKPRSDPSADVDPHLHLMCDLLPCPHSGQYQQGTRDQFEQSEKQGTRMKSSKGENSDFDHERDICDSKAYEQRKYKQYLEAEKPDIDSPKSDMDNRKDSQNTLTDNIHHKHSDLEKIVQDIAISRNEKVDQIDSEDASAKHEKGDKRPKQGEESDKVQDQVTKGKSSNRHMMNEKNRTCVDTNDSKEAVLKPKHSSSPNLERKGVNAAIGQVIKEHLFSTSTSTVLSSVDSLPPSASQDRFHGRKPHTSQPQSNTQSTDTDRCDSDGEFPEDELLVMLRTQRAVYEQQLQEIDRLIGDVER